jgi:hypothetical protein
MSKSKSHVIERLNRGNHLSRYPHIKLKLIGVIQEKDIIHLVASKLRLSGIPEPFVRVYIQNSTKACYSDVLKVAKKWITIE